MKLIKIFVNGGPIMWPILFLSIIGLSILIWKALEFRAGRKNATGLGIVSTIITAEPMLGILGTVTGIMQTFSALDSTGTTANPLAATAGIGEALITTAAGLIASLILLFPYNILDGMLDDDSPKDEPKTADDSQTVSSTEPIDNSSQPDSQDGALKETLEDGIVNDASTTAENSASVVVNEQSEEASVVDALISGKSDTDTSTEKETSSDNNEDACLEIDCDNKA